MIHGFRTARAIMMATIFCLPSAIQAQGQEGRRFYAIRLNDQLAGYAVSQRRDIQVDDRPVVRVESTTTLKLAMLGTERNILLESATDLTADDRPLRYHMALKSNETVQHTEAEFSPGKVRIWSYADGEDRGAAKEVALSDGALVLGSNNFALWEVLVSTLNGHATEDGKVTLDVLVPELGQLQQFEFVRGQPRDMMIANSPLRAVPWRNEAEQMTAWSDMESGAFVRLDLPAQQSIIELADASVERLVAESHAHEVLARHFAKSNVRFDDFLSVTELTAHVDVRVIGEGVENQESVLQTPMQRFEGEKQGDRITGVVSISSRPFDVQQSPPFPQLSEESDLAEWLKPSLFIESDHEQIVAKSAELSVNATTRWEAVRDIGNWVYQEIAYKIADSPSARLALEKRQGDCGPHSTLMVALLRASGIPARLVGGLVYTPTFGGSFGQHAWVEVHMGPAGWVAVDPTTGESERLSATHIKLFEGMGGVIPSSIEVKSFEPPNRAISPATLAEPYPLSWPLDTEFIFRYAQENKEIGTETITISKTERDDAEVYRMESNLSLSVAGGFTSRTELITNLRAQPIFFKRELNVADRTTTIQCEFERLKVKVAIQGTQNLTQAIDLPENVFCFDNNLMASFVMICSQLELQPDQALTVQTFHPSSLQIIPLTFTPQEPAAIAIGDQQIDCFECLVTPIQNSFWISKDRKFLRAQQGPLVIEATKFD